MSDEVFSIAFLNLSLFYSTDRSCCQRYILISRSIASDTCLKNLQAAGYLIVIDNFAFSYGSSNIRTSSFYLSCRTSFLISRYFSCTSLTHVNRPQLYCCFKRFSKNIRLRPFRGPLGTFFTKLTIWFIQSTSSAWNSVSSPQFRPVPITWQPIPWHLGFTYSLKYIGFYPFSNFTNPTLEAFWFEHLF